MSCFPFFLLGQEKDNCSSATVACVHRYDSKKKCDSKIVGKKTGLCKTMCKETRTKYTCPKTEWKNKVPFGKDYGPWPQKKSNYGPTQKNNWTEDMIFFSTPIWNQPMRFLNEQTSVGGLNHIGSEREGW